MRQQFTAHPHPRSQVHSSLCALAITCIVFIKKDFTYMFPNLLKLSIRKNEIRTSLYNTTKLIEVVTGIQINLPPSQGPRTHSLQQAVSLPSSEPCVILFNFPPESTTQPFVDTARHDQMPGSVSMSKGLFRQVRRAADKPVL